MREKVMMKDHLNYGLITVFFSQYFCILLLDDVFYDQGFVFIGSVLSM